MKNRNLRRLKGTIPAPQMLTIAHLRDSIKVPDFQRWIVESNILQITDSIAEVGVLRYPVIYYCQDTQEEFIIDGNHLRTILINPKNGYKDEDKVPCIYKVVATFKDAAKGFKNLNTKGKSLDWVDITKLYAENVDGPSVYKDVWALLGNPRDANEVRKVKGFTVPTIIEFLIGKRRKREYNNGEITVKHFEANYSERKILLNYLLQFANKEWDQKFVSKGYKAPSGHALNGFANYWFKNDLQKKSEHWEHLFLNAVNNVYIENLANIENGLIICRDNAGVLMEEFFKKKAKAVKKEAKEELVAA